MDFADVVMKRRAVRRFEEGGVDRKVIERIARLAQRTPSAGFSQGQRLVVVTDPVRRREVARICGEAYYEADFGPWISECAAQFIPCVSEAIYHRRYQEPDKVRDDGSEIDWPVPFWWVDIGTTMQTIMLAAVDEGLGCGFVGPDIDGLRGYVGVDMVLGDAGDYAIEINPRLTTSYLGLRQLCQQNLAELILRLAQGETVAPPTWHTGEVRFEIE